MSRVLEENHNLGSQTKEEELKNLNSEKQNCFIRTREHLQTMNDEVEEGLHAIQLRSEFKEKIEL